MCEQEQRKIFFQGIIKSVQPRSTVWRYRLDNRTHRTVGYNIFLTIKALPLTENDIERIVNEIVAIQLEDNISFTITKIETIINRSIANTRMRDFYDIHELASLVGNDEELAQKAFVKTCKKRNTIFSKDKGPVIRRIEE